MPVPDYQSMMSPILQLLRDGDRHANDEIRDMIAEHFGLLNFERQELIPSGTETLLNNRVSWALTYLSKAGLVARPLRSYYQITERGRIVLNQHPYRVDNDVLAQFPEFLAFRQRIG
ncbi:MAG: restriction endonuclease, partial [Dehalococcoidia bacterium]|nr:restriction endonuclease [Dehalococcoidia bacterium]